MALFNTGTSGRVKSNDINGDAAILAYNALSGDTAQSLEWRLITNHKLKEIYQFELQSLLVGLATALFAVAIGTFITARIINHSIAMPLGIVTKMAQSLANGDLVRGMSDTEKDKVRVRQDEIGEIGQAFDRLIDYMQGMGIAATSIANNDLTTSVTPRSENDELGNAFAKMVADCAMPWDRWRKAPKQSHPPLPNWWLHLNNQAMPPDKLPPPSNRWPWASPNKLQASPRRPLQWNK
ncbi:MAG: HAMP domain-containing protein [Anaerolineales bacterium]|nr:HAMP domain-containing protein [Anaerolineales bacterium]